MPPRPDRLRSISHRRQAAAAGGRRPDRGLR